MYTADYFISKLQLENHIEGGYFKEVYTNSYSLNSEALPIDFDGERALSSIIYYLLKSGQISKFHKLKFDEMWFYHYGSPLVIHMIDENGILESVKLGLDVANSESLQVLVPANVVFAAEVCEEDSFSLVSCMVSPGFDYRDFKIYSGQELSNIFPQHKKIIAKFNGV